MYFVDFCKALNESQWRGWIHEVGFGLPLQAAYLDVPGASATIISTGCLYDKSVQGLGDTRSVSQEGATAFASNVMNDQIAKLPSAYTYLFSIGVSGAHKVPEQRGDSHAWVSVVTTSTCDDYDGETWSFHVTFDKDVYRDRKYAGKVLRNISADFLCAILSLKGETIEKFINKYRHQVGFSVDVVSCTFGNELSLENMISLAASGKPVIIRDGQLIRPTDVLRENTMVYRGSFNPPTITHEAIGEDALYEIGVYNSRKGMADLEDIAHRVNMLNAIGKDVMITYSEALFADIDKTLRRVCCNDYKYVVGTDTFNSVVDTKWYSDYSFQLVDFSEALGGSSFIVMPRDGIELNETVITKYIGYKVIPNIEYDCSISSSRARAGEHDILSVPVKEYIERVGLYQ